MLPFAAGCFTKLLAGGWSPLSSIDPLSSDRVVQVVGGSATAQASRPCLKPRSSLPIRPLISLLIDVTAAGSRKTTQETASGVTAANKVNVGTAAGAASSSR